MLKDNLPHFIYCSDCSKNAMLVIESGCFYRNICGEMHTIISDRLLYKCECGSIFTTTLSDTISFNLMMSRINAIERTIRIKNIFGKLKIKKL